MIPAPAADGLTTMSLSGLSEQGDFASVLDNPTVADRIGPDPDLGNVADDNRSVLLGLAALFGTIPARAGGPADTGSPAAPPTGDVPAPAPIDGTAPAPTTGIERPDTPEDDTSGADGRGLHDREGRHGELHPPPPHPAEPDRRYPVRVLLVVRSRVHRMDGPLVP
jgi:hypothetical protein